jgi:hypothetical protein
MTIGYHVGLGASCRLDCAGRSGASGFLRTFDLGTVGSPNVSQLAGEADFTG